MLTASRPTGGERRTLLVVYDVLHFLCLHGPRVRREEVVEYLHRATTRRKTLPSSRLRAFERFKQNLAALGITYETDVSNLVNGEVWFSVEEPHAAKAAVAAILDANGNEEKRHEGKDAA